MGTDTVQFITPLKAWEPIGSRGVQQNVRNMQGNREPALFSDILHNVVGQVYSTQRDVENKQYLLATGQLDDAHSLPIAEAKAALSLDILISLRDKALGSYNELIKINV